MHFALQRDIRRSFNPESGKKGRVHCLEPDALGCSSFVTNSANTRAQKIDTVIMADPLAGRICGGQGLRRRKGQSQFANDISRKCLWSALLPFAEQLRCMGWRPELDSGNRVTV